MTEKRQTDCEKAGDFFCHACLTSHPATEKSPDPRYCQGCYDFLIREAEKLPENKRPAWIPKITQTKNRAEKPIQVFRGRGIKYVHCKRQKN